MTLGVLLALASALVWGSGDFCGGRASTRSGPFAVLALAATSGIALLVVMAWVSGEPFAADRSLLWAVAAGVAGSLGIVALYGGLAIGSAATVAPLAAVIAAAIPVAYGALSQGLPRPTQLVGFVVALAGIWLVARSSSARVTGGAGARHGVAAGAGFGAFLILIAQVEVSAVYIPLAAARAMMLVTAVVALTMRRAGFPSLASNPIGLLAGVLDAGGNVLYLLARQHVRLDIAAVLSSLYPVATVALSRALTGERVSVSQWVGAAVCLVAVVLIAT